MCCGCGQRPGVHLVISSSAIERNEPFSVDDRLAYGAEWVVRTTFHPLGEGKEEREKGGREVTLQATKYNEQSLNKEQKRGSGQLADLLCVCTAN